MKMAEMIEALNSFVENGGRLRKGEEPKFGEPFYGEYMEQFIPLHYKPGDRVRLQEKIRNNEEKTYEGLIIALDYRLELLISGKKVHKDKRNKKDFCYRHIKSIEMIKPDDGTFDLSVVDLDKWEWENNLKKVDAELWQRKTESRRKQRSGDKEEFHKVYPDVDFDKTHVIKVDDGCSLYWPFEYNQISAEIFMVRDGDKITSVPCKTGTPFPNKNSFHAYNCKPKDHYPDLYLYLPDNGFLYEDVNIVCVWTIDNLINVVNIHHVGTIKPVEDEHNMIFVDMSVNPLLGYGESLFTDPRHSSLLECMMNRDIYIVLNKNNDTASLVRSTEVNTEDEVLKYLFMSNMALNNFDLKEVISHIVSAPGKCFPFVEVFCNIDKEPERYFSSSWRNCREKYQFKLLENG